MIHEWRSGSSLGLWKEGLVDERMLKLLPSEAVHETQKDLDRPR